jgi:hypothetical protein|tara:strand:- start:1612 stop:1902 length:291 start_codon:yes stop_codon:yes gene_type:complete
MANKVKVRSQKYLAHIRKHPCLICGTTEVQAHHLRHADQRGWGMKNGDEWAVPLCADHHMDCHRTGKENMWWVMNGIDAMAWAELTYKNWMEKQNG